MRIPHWKDKLLTIGIFAVVLLGYLLIKPTCPMLWLLHIPCPGCGMTRAWFRVLALDFPGAFQMHGMFWSVPILGVYYLYDWKLFRNRWVDGGVLLLIALGFAINWIVHLILG